MNTKLLMTISSLTLGLAGIFALFAPDVLLMMFNVSASGSLSVLIQLIGGIYARPISLANFSHFFSGTLILAKYLLANEFNLTIVLVLIVYIVFALIFYWLVFRATGLNYRDQ